MAEIKGRYPLIIVGAGPAGLTASIYASRYRVANLVIGEALGGLAFEAHKICNFPTEQEITGMKLVEKMQRQAESLGVSIVIDRVVEIKEKNSLFELTTQQGNLFLAEAVLLAIGTKHRRLNLPDEDKFIGKGVSYCATCDAMFYKDKTVAVIGGSDSANTASLYLAEIAAKVYQIYRRSKLRGDTTWIHQIAGNERIQVIYNTEVVDLEGEGKLEKIALSRPYQGDKKLAVDGLFVEIGAVPQKVLVEDLALVTDKGGYIKTTSDQRTSHSGVWAAGDITTASNGFRQIITACSEGAVAAEDIFRFFQGKTSSYVAG